LAGCFLKLYLLVRDPLAGWLTACCIVGTCHEFASFLFLYGLAVAGVHDGYVLTKSISRSPVGGSLLNQCLQKSLEKQGTVIRPRQTFNRAEKKGFPGEFDVSFSAVVALVLGGVCCP
jgi:hypothetical protein